MKLAMGRGVGGGLLATALVLSACGDDSSSSGGGAAGGAGEGGSGGAGDPYAAMYACEETNFAAQPLSGPGYDAETGFVGEPQATYIASTTQIYVAPEKQKAFLDASIDVIGQLADTPGLVAFSVGGDTECQVNRTMSIWESEDAMYAFVTSGAHAVAMGQLTELSLTGKTTHWTTTPEEIEAQTWDTVRAKLAEEDPSELYD
ncbi:MAG: antibiotic biosynthesis monooxygenase [Myxococcales bacterium]|nr:antibiotic biosynthesis monooxygenase [Myxococcales bacterium]